MHNLVVKDNALIDASYTLGLVEQRLVLLAIVGARETGLGIDSTTMLRIHASSYINQFNADKSTAYRVLNEAAKNLFNRYFTYSETDAKTGKLRIVQTRWVSKIAYIEDAATVEICFSPDVVPFVTRLEKNFTSYELQQLAEVTSLYAVRLYELLIRWRTVEKTPIFELEKFRGQLGLGVNEYKAMGDFKKRVLDLAIKQINEHTDITVKYEQHKQGRTITGFSFAFKQKKKSLKVLEEKSKPAKKTAEPLKNAWNTPENSLFKTLCAKCPTLTREYVENLAKTQNKSIHDLLNIMFMEYAKVDSFELQPTS